LKLFKDKKYILVGILATATSDIVEDPKYRFIYPYQQILIAGLNTEGTLIKEDEISINPLKPVSESSNWFNSFVIYFTLVVVLVFLAIWVYRKWIKNILKRHKRQQLSEQGTGEVRYQEFTSYT
jgi:large-conductance mechanosensitive channel